MLGRPAPLWILAVLGTIGGLLCTIVLMQFAEVLPWAGDEASYIGGNWTGVLAYGLAGAFYFAAAYAWLTIKPWAHMVTILAALIGFFVPFISHMDGTDPRSSAIAPLVIGVLMLFMVFRPSTNRAMAAALSGEGSVKTAKTPPPPKPMSAARKREVAEEQRKAAAKAAASPAAAPSSVAAPVAAASASVAQAASVLPKPASGAIPKPAAAAPVRPAFAGMAKSAASMLGKTSSAPSKPAVAKPAAPAPAPQSPSLPANQPRPRGFRADEV